MELLDKKILLVLIGLITFFLLENLFPKESFKYKKKIKRICKNLTLWLLNVGFTPILILPITIYATTLNLNNIFALNKNEKQLICHSRI